MPFFRTTHNIFIDKKEYFDPNWFDTPFLQLPPSLPWDYKKEMQIEDVDIWEVIFEYSSGLRLYAAWNPHAEFYLLTDSYNNIETYYGKLASKRIKKRLKDFDINYQMKKIWVEPENVWLYEK